MNNKPDVTETLPVYLIGVTRRINQIQKPMTLAVLSNTLTLHEIQHDIMDLLPVDPDLRELRFKEWLPKHRAIYGFTITAGNHHITETERYAELVMQANRDNIIVYGGPLPTAIPEMMLERCRCKYIVAGEGEVAFPMLIDAINRGIEYPAIDGVYFRRNGKVEGCHSRVLRQLDRLSLPDFSKIDMDYYVGYLRETNQSFELMSSRGCTGGCDFCYKFMGRGFSQKSADDLLDEIEKAIAAYGIRKIYFVDENFLQNRQRFFRFADRKRERKMDFDYIFQTRLDTVDDRVCSVGVETGLTCISSGAESAVQSTLYRTNKGLSVELIESKLKLMRDYGILSLVAFMVGFPWDRPEDYEELLRFVEKNQMLKRFKVHNFTPLPRTTFYRNAVLSGKIADEWEYITGLGDIYWERALNFTSMPDDVLDGYYRQLYEAGQKAVSWPTSEKYRRTIGTIH